jgi:hypothetical protein
MPTIAGIPTSQQLAQAFTPGTAAAAAASATPQAAAAAAARAAQVGFATAAYTQLYPGHTIIPGCPPNAAGNVVRAWLDTSETGIHPVAAERGAPAPLAWWQRRRLRGQATTPQPVPVWLQSRPYDRGAMAYAPHFGVIPTNPIGSGVFAPYRIPTIAGPGARYLFGAIWFDVQTVPTSLRMNPTVPIETVNALIAKSRVGGTYLTTG